MRNIGLNEWAEANEMIVVYPQAAGSASAGEGCWNWASYDDDPLFDTKHGAELTTIVHLVNDLQGALERGQSFTAEVDAALRPLQPWDAD